MLNRLDRALEYVAPIYAAKRLNARARISALQAAMAYYDGADVGRRGSSIRRSGAAADTIAARSLPKLRAGSHDLVRNNPHARRGLEAIVSNIVGAGIIPRFKRGRSTVTELDELARRTLDATSIDVCGQLDYYGLQGLACNTAVESGASLVTRHWVDDEFPVRFQVLEPDHLDSSRDTTLLPDGGRIIQGVQFDRRGRRSGYWLYPEHPGSAARFSISSKFWPARDVTHIYRIDRPGQVSGIPWLAPVMLRIADFDDYENAQLVRQKIAACFAVFYNDNLGGEGPKTDIPEKVQPGMIGRLPNGSEITFASPPTVGADHQSYSSVSLHAIAAGLGVSYEALTGDLKGVNFSSGRLGRNEFERNVERWRWQMLIPMGCDVMIRWWLEGAELTGFDVSDVEVRHQPPPKEMISPEREVPATTGMLRSGQKTLPQVAAERGMDVVELLDEIQETNRMLDERGLVLDSDPRRVSVAGLTQARAGDSLTLPPTGPLDDDEDPDDD